MVQVYIRSRRRAVSQSGHPALTCLPNGEVFGNAFGAAGQLQQWELQTDRDEDCGMVYITLRSSNGCFLSATPDGTVRAIAPMVGENERWFLRNCDDCVSLMSSHGTYLTNDCRFDCGKIVRADRESIIDWAKWIIVDDHKAMTSQTAIGKVVIGGVYTAALFLPVAGAIGLVTVANRSMVFGGATNPFAMVRQNDERPGELIKEPIEYTTSAITKTTAAATSSIAFASSRTLENWTSGSKEDESSRYLERHRHSEKEPMNVRASRELMYSRDRYSQ